MFAYAGIGITAHNSESVTTTGTSHSSDVPTPSDYLETRYKRSETQPATPEGNDPEGWTITPPTGTITLWFSIVKRNAAGDAITSWSTPVQNPWQTEEEILDKIDNGYDSSVGTTTPTTPFLIALGAFQRIKLRADRQDNLRWLSTYRWRVTDNPLALTDPGSCTWYGLKQDGSDWKDTSVNHTDWPLEELVHNNIPPADLAYSCSITSGSAVVTLSDTSKLDVGDAVTGTGIPVDTTITSIDSGTQITLSANATATGTETLTFGGGDKKMGRTLYYQVCRASTSDGDSAWSDAVEATTSLVDNGSVGVHVLDVNHMSTGFLNAIIAQISDSLVVTDDYGWLAGTYISPSDGDKRAYVKEAEFGVQEYQTDAWADLFKISVSGSVGSRVADALITGTLNIKDANTQLSAYSDSRLRVTTAYGTMDFGPANTSHCHIYTDRNDFVFNKKLWTMGGLYPWSSLLFDIGSATRVWVSAYLKQVVFPSGGNGSMHIGTKEGLLTGYPNGTYATIKTSGTLYFDVGGTYCMAINNGTYNDEDVTQLHNGSNDKLYAVNGIYGAVFN